MQTSIHSVAMQNVHTLQCDLVEQQAKFICDSPKYADNLFGVVYEQLLKQEIGARPQQWSGTRQFTSLMDAASHKFFESTTHRALHAHSFSRSSSQASGVLTDLLSRYLQLLASSCVKYAQHAGRASITIRDAVCALDELGVGVDELSEYCTLEGMELGRHYRPSARRIEELSEFKCELT